MVIKSEEEYEAALKRLEQLFGQVEDEDAEREFKSLTEGLVAWEEKMRSH